MDSNLAPVIEPAPTDTSANSNVRSSEIRKWRDVLPEHPAADLFPLMAADELKALGEDIKRNGLQQKVIVGCTKSDGSKQCFLIDGRNRLDAREQAGLPVLNEAGDFLADGIWMYQFVDPYAYVISANIHRRHLTPEQKRDLVAKVLEAAPEKSNRTIAEMAHVDHKTVASVRAEKRATGEIPQLTKTIGKDGKARPTKPARLAAKGDDTPTAPPKSASISTAPPVATITPAIEEKPETLLAHWQRASCEERKAVLDQALPKMPDYELVKFVRSIGVNRVLEAAVAAEAAE